MDKVLNVSEAVSIALHAMVSLVKNQDKLLSAREISVDLGVSLNHLAKVLQRLAKVGLISSIKGAKGGFKLSKNPQNITFLNIYEAIEGKLHYSNCLFNKKVCNNKECIMANVVEFHNGHFEKYLKETKLSGFMPI